MSRKIAINSAPVTAGSRYPVPYDEPCRGRIRQRLGDAAGLTQFGVNLTRLPPGCWSSQRHWHAAEDEFVYVVEGEVVLVTDEGKETLRAGECAGFKAGAADGHHIQNRSKRDALLLEVGTRRPQEEEVIYPDIDMKIPRGAGVFTHMDGTCYADAAQRSSKSGK
jgi:uncharacterized cupin superfamily protein